jgi:hypothetical protein
VKAHASRGLAKLREWEHRGTAAGGARPARAVQVPEPSVGDAR